MKKLQTLAPSLAVAFVVFALLSCEDKADPNTIAVDVENLEFPAEGGTKTFQVVSTTDWDVIKQERDYITLSQEHGSGNQTVSVTMSPNTLVVARQKLIAVRAANGVTKNVWVSQLGKSGSEDLFMMLPSHKYISGTAGSEMLAIAYCLSPRCYWNATGGADWLEVTKDGTHWESTAKGISSYYKEGVDLKFRTVSNNEDQKDRTASFKIYCGSEKTYEFSVTQLGSSRASISSSAVLANSIAMDWIYGYGLTEFYVKVTTEDITLSSIQKSQLTERNGWKKCLPTSDNLMTFSNLKEDTKYYVYNYAVSSNGGARSRRSYTTGSSQNQPEAKMSVAKNQGGLWKWTTTKSDDTDGYHQWVTDDQRYFNYTDAELAWYINNHIGELDLYKDKVVEQTHAGSGPFMVVTWAYDYLGVSSGVINRQIVGK